MVFMKLKHAKVVKVQNRAARESALVKKSDEVIRGIGQLNAGSLIFGSYYVQLCNHYKDLNQSTRKRWYREIIKIAKIERVPRMLKAIDFLEDKYPGIKRYR